MEKHHRFSIWYVLLGIWVVLLIQNYLHSAFAIKKNYGGTIITNVEASMCVEKMVKRQGGKVVRAKVGDVHVAQALKRHQAVLSPRAGPAQNCRFRDQDRGYSLSRPLSGRCITCGDKMNRPSHSRNRFHRSNR